MELEGYDPRKLDVVKEIMATTGLPRERIKKELEAVPVLLTTRGSLKEADMIKSRLEGRGAKVNVDVGNVTDNNR